MVHWSKGLGRKWSDTNKPRIIGRNPEKVAFYPFFTVREAGNEIDTEVIAMPDARDSVESGAEEAGGPAKFTSGLRRDA